MCGRQSCLQAGFAARQVLLSRDREGAVHCSGNPVQIQTYRELVGSGLAKSQQLKAIPRATR